MAIDIALQTDPHPFWRRRHPEPADFVVFFLVLPVAIAFLISLIGDRLIVGIPYLGALLYMVLHMFISWWTLSAGTWMAWAACRAWRPPAAVLCVLGFAIAIAPSTGLFRLLNAGFAHGYPVFAATLSETTLPAFTLDYLVYFVRYSTPGLLLYLAGIYGYRYAGGVDWLAYRCDEQPVEPAPGRASDARPLALRLNLTTLGPDAEILAIEAEEHYIRIWTDRGRELIRYRFRDAVAEFSDCNGAQVHRSWWVNFDRVRGTRKAGRGIELLLDGELAVPVSVAQRNTVLKALERRS